MMHIVIAKRSEKYFGCFDTFIWGKYVHSTHILPHFHSDERNFYTVVDILRSIERESGGGIKLTIVETVDEVRNIFGGIRDY